MKQAIDCVGVVCLKGDQVLLIKRGKPPRKGEWSIPGGRIEPGETEKKAALRELGEETGITAKLADKIETLDAKFEGFHYRLHDYIALWQSGHPVAADDADDACFVPLTGIETLGMWSETVRVIRKAALIIAEKDHVKSE